MKNQLLNPNSNRVESFQLGDTSRLNPELEILASAVDKSNWESLGGDDLVRICGAGNGEQRKKAMRELLNRFEPATFLICSVLVDSVEDAAVACEDAWVDVLSLKELQSLNGITGFRVALFSAIRKQCSRYTAMITPNGNADHRCYRNLVAPMVETERWMLALRFFGELSKNEIAAVLNLSIAEVKTGLWTAMQRIVQFGFAEETVFFSRKSLRHI